ncbi:vacuolar protein sorting-associated protein [Anaeramoeba ignava]|uniref:Vacuolar protein sorting-associated protein n=1 Tax=Anaeramoeba ignava TaxID=1746090 RepID=A0A9Q0LT01_ANAIG|nr:vacuolar protein sorting-associated protein [Anaeramoeba ignava]
MASNLPESISQFLLKIKDIKKRDEISKKFGNAYKRIPLFGSEENISGTILLQIKNGKYFKFNEILIEFIGQLEIKGEKPYKFLSITKQISSKTIIKGKKEWEFEFENVEKLYESFVGKLICVRYFIQVSIKRSFSKNLNQEFDIWILKKQEIEDKGNPIQIEVGVPNCLHIQIEYLKLNYDLQDVLIGKVFFIFSRVKLRSMEISFIRQETIIATDEVIRNAEVLAKFEIMDGSPNKGDCIPIRIFLQSIRLKPTYPNIENKCSVRYDLNLMLIDEKGNEYFKCCEIFLYRKSLQIKK